MDEKQCLLDVAPVYRTIIHCLTSDEVYSVLCEITFAIERMAENEIEKGFILLKGLEDAIGIIQDRKSKQATV